MSRNFKKHKRKIKKWNESKLLLSKQYLPNRDSIRNYEDLLTDTLFGDPPEYINKDDE